MKIKQFEDKPLAHFSYAVVNGNKMAVIDPARNPIPYYRYAEENETTIVAIFETHTHADFVSSHLQMHRQTGATIYASRLAQVSYPHQTFDQGDTLQMNDVEFTCINTPGHSKESITIVGKDKKEKIALFTGDTLFIGDVGRPDLQESSGDEADKREELAKTMFKTMKSAFNYLPDDALVYPGHGTGSFCGKKMGDEKISTLGRERKSNWAFLTTNETDFVNEILSGQPLVPAYFLYNVQLNAKGVPPIESTIANVQWQIRVEKTNGNILTIDTRDERDYKKNHLPNSINIMARTDDDAFETWLGTMVQPGEVFMVVVASVNKRDSLLRRIAKIGYEQQVTAVVTLADKKFRKMKNLCIEQFKANPEQYTIVDIRRPHEYEENRFFENAINYPLNELRQNILNIPTDKPILVHCAGGFRSAIGSSILDSLLPNTTVLDLGDDIQLFHHNN